MWEQNSVQEVIREDNEVTGTQLEENPKYIPPPRLRELLYDEKENDLRTCKHFDRTAPETQLYEITNSTLVTPSSFMKRPITDRLHVCTKNRISDSKSSGKYPRKCSKQRTCVYCRTKAGKYKWTLSYCPQCNVITTSEIFITVATDD